MSWRRMGGISWPWSVQCWSIFVDLYSFLHPPGLLVLFAQHLTRSKVTGWPVKSMCSWTAELECCHQCAPQSTCLGFFQSCRCTVSCGIASHYTLRSSHCEVMKHPNSPKNVDLCIFKVYIWKNVQLLKNIYLHYHGFVTWSITGCQLPIPSSFKTIYITCNFRKSHVLYLKLLR